MKYFIKVYGKNGKKSYFKFNEKQLKKLKKDVVSTDYSGAYELKNGDLVEILAMEYHEDRDRVIQRSHWYYERNLQKKEESNG